MGVRPICWGVPSGGGRRIFGIRPPRNPKSSETIQILLMPFAVPQPPASAPTRRFQKFRRPPAPPSRDP